ncbi:MAG: hypothetical protein ACJATI_004769 [Halioglobus sp.]|jgi:hypothetical protein
MIGADPTTDIFQLKNDTNISSIIIYNIVGRQIYTFNHRIGEVRNISILKTGMYLVGLRNQDSAVVRTIRLTKRELKMNKRTTK